MNGNERVRSRKEPQEAVSEDGLGRRLSVAITTSQWKATAISPFDPVNSKNGNALISAVLAEILTGELYDSATSQALSMKVAEEVRTRLKGLGLDHYKYVVQVNLSEQRGQAVHITAQCVWDSDCDAMSHSFFANDSLWCETVVFAVFHY